MSVGKKILVPLMMFLIPAFMFSILLSVFLITLYNNASHADKYGNHSWKNEQGRYHRDYDLPAYIAANGIRYWYNNGRLHRKNAPAIITPEGEELWYENGSLHRLDGPAINKTNEWYINGEKQLDPGIIDGNGSRLWEKDGKLHRLNGPAVIFIDGSQQWYKEGVRHRDDGPAEIEPDGTKRWYKEGVLHREDGPATMWSDGGKEWWVNGKRIKTTPGEIPPSPKTKLPIPEKPITYITVTSLVLYSMYKLARRNKA